MSRWMAALVACVISLAPHGAVRSEENAAFTVIGPRAERLREDFNRAAGSVRLLFVVDPVCPGCLRGLGDVNRALLAETHDPRLVTFVVHVPVIGAEADDIEPAAQLLDNPRVRHYWNPDGSFGRELSEAMGLEGDGEPAYAWDVWLIYRPEATWGDALPPPPTLLMHQLYALEGSEKFPHLDREVFAQEVHRLLANLPAPAAAE